MTPEAPTDATSRPSDNVRDTGRAESWIRTLSAAGQLWSEIESVCINNAAAVINRHEWRTSPRPIPREIFYDAVAWLISGDTVGSYKCKDAEDADSARRRLTKKINDDPTSLMAAFAEEIQTLASKCVDRRRKRIEFKMKGIISQAEMATLRASDPDQVSYTVCETVLQEGLASIDWTPTETKRLLGTLWARFLVRCPDPLTRAVAEAMNEGELDFKDGAHSQVAARLGISIDKLSKLKKRIDSILDELIDEYLGQAAA